MTLKNTANIISLVDSQEEILNNNINSYQLLLITNWLRLQMIFQFCFKYLILQNFLFHISHFLYRWRHCYSFVVSPFVSSWGLAQLVERCLIKHVCPGFNSLIPNCWLAKWIITDGLYPSNNRLDSCASAILFLFSKNSPPYHASSLIATICNI